MGFSHVEKRCRPPILRMTSRSGERVLTMPWVPTGMKMGVWMSPWAVRRMPVRAKVSGHRVRERRWGEWGGKVVNFGLGNWKRGLGWWGVISDR